MLLITILSSPLRAALNPKFIPSFLDDPVDFDDGDPAGPYMSLFDAWNASRPTADVHEGEKNQRVHLQPGSHRKCTLENITLAFRILQATFFDMISLLWNLNPIRTTVLILFTILRGLFPAYRGLSQASILDEASLISVSFDA